jgi:hypothetical protein
VPDALSELGIEMTSQQPFCDLVYIFLYTIEKSLFVRLAGYSPTCYLSPGLYKIAKSIGGRGREAQMQSNTERIPNRKKN